MKLIHHPETPARSLPTVSALIVGIMLAISGCASTPPANPTPSANPTPPASPSPSAIPSPSASMTNVEPVLVLTSADFTAGGDLGVRHSANAWGQCSGDNLNPQLSWEGAPEGTVTYAITMRDLSAGNYSHWVHVNIPANVTSVATGGSESLPGIAGRNASPGVGYFGPCPPGPNHRYEFTVWALDAELVVPASPTYPDFFTASQGHVLDQASIIGIYSPVD